jgi:hypothetical protein
VETVLIVGRPAASLLEENEQAMMVMLGSRGLGGWTGLLLGSVVAIQASTHAQRPIVLVSADVRPRMHVKPTIGGRCRRLETPGEGCRVHLAQAGRSGQDFAHSSLQSGS